MTRLRRLSHWALGILRELSYFAIAATVTAVLAATIGPWWTVAVWVVVGIAASAPTVGFLYAALSAMKVIR